MKPKRRWEDYGFSLTILCLFGVIGLAFTFMLWCSEGAITWYGLLFSFLGLPVVSIVPLTFMIFVMKINDMAGIAAKKAVGRFKSSFYKRNP